MTVRWLVDVSQARTAPESIRRRLREMDETAEVVYLGRGRWIVGKVRPNALVRQQAIRMLDKYTTELSNGARLSERGKEKVRFALLALQGFRPVAEYRMREPDDRVVQDFERSRWLWLHESENETWRQMDAAQEQKALEARKQLGDEGLAREALNTAFKLNFGRASVKPASTPVPSGRVRHVTISHH